MPTSVGPQPLFRHPVGLQPRRGPIATVPPLPVNSRYIAGCFLLVSFSSSSSKLPYPFPESIIFPSSTLYTPRTGSWVVPIILEHSVPGDTPRLGSAARPPLTAIGTFQPHPPGATLQASARMSQCPQPGIFSAADNEAGIWGSEQWAAAALSDAAKCLPDSFVAVSASTAGERAWSPHAGPRLGSHRAYDLQGSVPSRGRDNGPLSSVRRLCRPPWAISLAVDFCPLTLGVLPGSAGGLCHLRALQTFFPRSVPAISVQLSFFYF